MPSIANQDFKIYGLLEDSKGGIPIGIPAKYCGEFYAAYTRATASAKAQAEVIDGFVFSLAGDTICRLLSAGCYWFDTETESIETIVVNHRSPAYYDALWAIQQALYANDEDIVGPELELGISDNGNLFENSTGYPFVNEDGYLIKGTSADGKLASLYLGERAVAPEESPIVRLESLLPLVGELPLETTEIW